MKTLIELAQWMEDRCYNDDWYSLLGSPKPLISNAYVVEFIEGRYVWFYTERGTYDEICSFATEEEIVAHAFKDIQRNKTATRHMVGFSKDPKDDLVLKAALKGRQIAFFADEIPYDDHPRYRVFVYGCDMKQVEDLQLIHNQADYFQADPTPGYFDAAKN